MKKIILIGGGGHCKSVIDVIEQQGLFNIKSWELLSLSCAFS